MNKRELYEVVEQIRSRYDIPALPPFDAKILCVCNFGLNYEEMHIRTSGLRGMSHIPSKSVVLDISLQPEEKNFFCAHEIMHHLFHKDRGTKVYSGYERTTADQNPIVEWEANEGAAQFLIPYQTFIPDYVDASRRNAREPFPEIYACKELAKKYFVSPHVIKNRAENLNYEIYQYLHGVPIKFLDIRSNTYLAKNKINVNRKKFYCRVCLSQLESSHDACPVCGARFHKENHVQFSKYIAEGAGYMIFPGIQIDDNGRAMECPTCHNTELPTVGTFCPICGQSLINECSADNYDKTKNCYEYLPGNARYCPHCGSRSTYFAREFLSAWDYKPPFADLPLDNDEDLTF